MVLNTVRKRVRTKEVDEDTVEELSEDDGGVTVEKIVTVTCLGRECQNAEKYTTNSTKSGVEGKGEVKEMVSAIRFVPSLR